MPVTWSILTPPTASGAIGVISLTGPTLELDSALSNIGLAGIAPGQVRLRDLLRIDTGLIARWTATECHLMPHGGPTVIRALTRKLTEHGFAASSTPTYPEARTDLESALLSTLARAASPRAIDLLLDQPRRWSANHNDDPKLNSILNRLIDPPLVVALGPPNIGKSTLVNTLSGRSISIVADEPGTTRDHVGVHLDLAGLVVRFLDTPGTRNTPDAIEREAQTISRHAASTADLILLTGDPLTPPPHNSLQAIPTLQVALRSDLGAPTWDHDIAVSSLTGRGIRELIDAVGECLVPRRALQDPRPWRFWSADLPQPAIPP